MSAKRTRKGEVRPFAKSDIGDVLDLTDMLIELEKKDPEASFHDLRGPYS
jgi:hypothetical protein